MLGGLSGLLGGVSSLLWGGQDVIENVAETVSPGATHSETTTGNLLNNGGLLGDLITGIEQGDPFGGIGDAYRDIIGPGGVVNDLGEGGGLGIEGFLGTALGTADGILGDGGLLG
ncbi:hypothetical protein L598_005800000100 [Mesorhizobium sp. J18]|uniref:hypothetical protein n=1 Tax=Mesorhizobium sp. J18 TaxID=935263 RepID=UPI00119BAEE3|nr:hypothetical protein [Mesorhizobium sp. J18]TWG91597.1 hypothetical protein L598_005800000100 [Mesorhizobium sp. J18]